MTPTAVERVIGQLLEPGEQLLTHVEATNGIVILTDRRVGINCNAEPPVALPYDQIARAEFNVEDGRPTSLILHSIGTRKPYILQVPDEQITALTNALGIIMARVAS